MDPSCTLDDHLRAPVLGIGNPRNSKMRGHSMMTCQVREWESPFPGEFHDPLPDNYQLSVNRLQGLLHRLKQYPAILKWHSSRPAWKGIIEAVPATGQGCFKGFGRTPLFWPLSIVLTILSIGQTNLIISFSAFQISKPMREAAFYLMKNGRGDSGHAHFS